MRATPMLWQPPPEASNRITFHDTEKDQYGLPVPILEYMSHPNSVAMHEHSAEMSKNIYESLGATRFKAVAGACFLFMHNAVAV